MKYEYNYLGDEYEYDYLDEDYVHDINVARKHMSPDSKEFPKYEESDIIDEDKTVRWNREEVARRIQLREDEINRLEGIRLQKITKVNNDAIDAIAVELLRRKIVLEEEEAKKKAEILFIHANTLRHREHEDAIYLVKQINRLVDFVEIWEGKGNYDEC